MMLVLDGGQVGSANSRGRGEGVGRGEVVTSGMGGDSMRPVVLRAREWVLHNRGAIEAECEVPEVSESSLGTATSKVVSDYLRG